MDVLNKLFEEAKDNPELLECKNNNQQQNQSSNNNENQNNNKDNNDNNDNGNDSQENKDNSTESKEQNTNNNDKEFERIKQGHDGNGVGCTLQVWKCDVQKCLPFVGSIHLGCFIDSFRNRG